MAADSRRACLLGLAAAVLLPSLATSAVFVLYAVAVVPLHSPLAAPAVIAAVLHALAAVLIPAVALRPASKAAAPGLVLSPALGIVLSLLAAVVAALTFAWAGLQHAAVPSTIVAGVPRQPLLYAGLGVFCLAITLQAAFWTAVLRDRPQPPALIRWPAPMPQLAHPMAADSGVDLQPTLSASAASPPPSRPCSRLSAVVTPRTSVRQSLGQMFRSPISTLHTPSVSLPSTIQRCTVREVNHFDTWEASDQSIHSQVAASLAVVERENLEAALGTPPPLCITTTTPRGGVVRHASPPLPETSPVFAPGRRSDSLSSRAPMFSGALGTPRLVRASILHLPCTADMDAARWNMDQARWEVESERESEWKGYGSLESVEMEVKPIGGTGKWLLGSAMI